MTWWSLARSTFFAILLGLAHVTTGAAAPPSDELPPLPEWLDPHATRPRPAGEPIRIARQVPPTGSSATPRSETTPNAAGEAGAGPTTAPGASTPPGNNTNAPATSSGNASAGETGTGTDSTASTNRDLSLPKAEREGGGGEPTEEAAAEGEAKAPEADPTKLLMNYLGMEESKVKVYGWLQNSFTGNANGTPRNGMNFGVNPNNLANRWMGNQYYLIAEKPLEQTDKINFGFRVDNLFGNDWEFNHMHGLLDTVAKPNHFNGYDPAQFYAEVHLPGKLSKGGTDIKGGRFYTILGYEVVPATGRPLLSVPYMFNYGQPFTHFGMLATTHVTDRINWYNGAVNGWDRWVDQFYKWNYLGGWTYTSKNGKATVAQSYIFGPDQFPRFLPANTVIVPTGTTPPPFLAGRRNPGYGGNWRTTFTTVFTYKWSDTFTQVVETDQSIEKNIPGLGPGGTNQDAEWYSFGNWFLWQFYKKENRDYITGVWRSEVFRDNNGARTGYADNFYEMTLGLIIKPKPYIWVRPEARYDWAQFTHPYNDGTRNSQLTLAFDVILLF